MRRELMQRHAAKRDAAAMLAGSARQGVDQRGLASAIAPQQGQCLAFGQFQGNTRQHHGLAVARTQALHL